VTLAPPPPDPNRAVTAVAPEPQALLTRAWPDYALLDSGAGRKLERYGRFTVVRPEPQCVWAPRLPIQAWDEADAIFDPSDEEDAGRWRFRKPPPDTFPLRWRDVTLKARFTPFRHLAFFPEQAANWAWLDAATRSLAARTPEPPRILNLFGYTGVASLACAAAGAAVVHVDASRRSVGWARENAELSGLADRPVRWIVEDCRQWVKREIKRGARYHGIILDPPKYGRGPQHEVWRLFEDLPELLTGCVDILEPDAGFLLLNAYAARISGLACAHAVNDAVRRRGDLAGGVVDWGELALAEDGDKARAIGLSFFARWSRGL
jgi:23S rRNA (cytosine1962-C5)-methyltransferase